ncbi:hypothetical protein BH09ACT12_BH09ACT12_05040 [soil metagenome]
MEATPTSTMAELFAPEPRQWGLRGDPFAWRAMADRLSGTPVPSSEAEVTGLLVAAFEGMIGVSLAQESPDSVFVEAFAGGGMSSGHVHLPTWRDRLVPLLVERASSLRC